METVTKNIMIVGVGGQGSLLASKLLGHLLCAEGYDVKVSEVHGMSQRGGSVVTYVKYGDKVWSPIIGEGEADIILAFEQLEAYRALPYLKKGGVVVTGTQCIDPMPVITGAAKYPENLCDKIAAQADLISADAIGMAREAGTIKAANVVLIGILARRTNIPYETWIEVLKTTVPPKFLDVNLKAFDMGWNHQ